MTNHYGRHERRHTHTVTSILGKLVIQSCFKLSFFPLGGRKTKQKKNTQQEDMYVYISRSIYITTVDKYLATCNTHSRQSNCNRTI